MTNTSNFKKIAGARWAIGRQVMTGEWIHLIEDTPPVSENEVSLVLLTLKVGHNDIVLRDHYFPKDRHGQRYPTFALMELWYELSPITASDAKSRV